LASRPVMGNTTPILILSAAGASAPDPPESPAPEPPLPLVPPPVPPEPPQAARTTSARPRAAATAQRPRRSLRISPLSRRLAAACTFPPAAPVAGVPVRCSTVYPSQLAMKMERVPRCSAGEGGESSPVAPGRFNGAGSQEGNSYENRPVLRRFAAGREQFGAGRFAPSCGAGLGSAAGGERRP